MVWPGRKPLPGKQTSGRNHYSTEPGIVTIISAEPNNRFRQYEVLCVPFQWTDSVVHASSFICYSPLSMHSLFMVRLQSAIVDFPLVKCHVRSYKCFTNKYDADILLACWVYKKTVQFKHNLEIPNVCHMRKPLLFLKNLGAIESTIQNWNCIWIVH